MAEAVFRSVQIGKETTFGTEVNATLVLPVEAATGELRLIRGTATPDEDRGRSVRNASGRGSHGVRHTEGSVSAVGTFQTLPHFLQMGLGAVTTSGVGPYTHTVTGDATSDTVKSYTWEVNDDTQDWVGTGIVIPSFELGFDAVTAGQNSPWMLSADLLGTTLTKGTATAALTAPATETMEGHLTTISEGSTSTAFGSLTALSSRMIAFSLRVEDGKPLRPYAGTDTPTDRGRLKRLGTVNATFKVATDTIGATFDHYNVSGAVPTYRRWRVSVTGSGTNTMTLDMQLKITDAHIEPNGRDGERTMSVTAETVDDSTLDTDIKFAIVNSTVSY